MNSQRLSLVLNVVLLVAVIFLYLKVFSGSNNSNGGSSDTAKEDKYDSTKVNQIQTEDGKLRIAFINVDSLNANYEYLKEADESFKKMQQEAENKMRARQQAAQKRAQEIEKDYELMTMSQQKAAQAEMQKMQKDLARAEEEIFGPLQQKFNAEKNKIDRAVKNYVREYCVKENIDFVLGDMQAINFLIYANPAMDITDVIIDGLNEEYKATQAEVQP
jgi:outer membrane protein